MTRASVDELLALRFEVARRRANAGARAGASGQHVSHAHARGVDYAESRAYQPGDDIRVMDWRVTARTGKPHTKLFLEERERDLIVLLDTNAGMRFGTRRRFKSVQAARAAALAAWMTVAGGDRVGLLAFGSQSTWFRPRGGARGVVALIGVLAADVTAESAAQSLSAALTVVRRRVRAGSRVLLISDGFSCDADAQAALTGLGRTLDVGVLGIADALESRAPGVAELAVLDGARPLRLSLRPPAARAAFESALGRGRRDLDALCRASHVPLAWLDTVQSPQPALRQLLVGDARQGRR